MRIMLATTTLAGALTLVSGCGSGSGSGPSALPAQSPAVSPASASSSNRPSCPNPEGQFCLGRVTAGTYRTVEFWPSLEYVVPDGWGNYEDTKGNFLLVPPDGHLKGVNAATSDFIGVYTSVLAHANTCPSAPAPGVGTTPAAIMRWLVRDPALRASPPREVTVGGLHGLVTTLRISATWSMTCRWSHGIPLAPLMVGTISSFLDHNLVPGQATRLYLLSHPNAEGHDAALAIEVVDIKDVGHLDAYSSLVSRFRFEG